MHVGSRRQCHARSRTSSSKSHGSSRPQLTHTSLLLLFGCAVLHCPAGVGGAVGNIPPEFTKASNTVRRDEDAGAVTVANFFTDISIGEKVGEMLRLYPGTKQEWEFDLVIVSQKPPYPKEIFKTKPRANPAKGSCSVTCGATFGDCTPPVPACTATTANLEFEALPQTSAEVVIKVILRDTGGTVAGKNEMSETFTLFIEEVNDGPPGFELYSLPVHPNIEVYEDSCNTIEHFVKSFTVGPEPFEYFAGETLDYQLFPQKGAAFGGDIFAGKLDPFCPTADCVPAPTGIGAGHTGIDVSFPDGTLSFCTAGNVVDKAQVVMSCIDHCRVGQPLRPAYLGARDWGCWASLPFDKATRSCPHRVFSVSIIPVNDPPGRCPDASRQTITVDECTSAGTVGGCRHSLDMFPALPAAGRLAAVMTPGGGADEAGQTVAVHLEVKERNLYLSPPELDENTGKMTFTLRQFATSGDNTDTITFVYTDDGGTDNRWCSGQVGPGCQKGTDTRICTVTLKLRHVNQPPSWEAGPDPKLLEDALPTRFPGFATRLSPGADPNEATQVLSFTCAEVVPPGGKAILAGAPTIAVPSGDLSVTPAKDQNGVAEVSCDLSDGIAAVSHSFKVTVEAVNDCPTVPNGFEARCTQGESLRVPLGAVTRGPANEASQTLSYSIWIDPRLRVADMFSTPPVVDPATAELSFACQPTAAARTTIRVTAEDDGGAVPPNCAASPPVSITLFCAKRDTPPSFDIRLPEKNVRIWMGDDSQVKRYPRHATGIDKGGLQDAWQTLRFEILIESVADGSNINIAAELGLDTQAAGFSWDTVPLSSVFDPASVPSLDEATGELSFKLQPGNHLFGSVLLKVLLKDDGASPLNVSPPKLFTIEILKESVPTFSTVGAVEAMEDSGAARQIWAHSISAGGAAAYSFEVGQPCQDTSLFEGLVRVTPSGDATHTGFLEFTPKPDAWGEAVCQVCATTDATPAASRFCSELRIVIHPANDPPVFSLSAANFTVFEDSGVYDDPQTSNSNTNGTDRSGSVFLLRGAIPSAHVGAVNEIGGVNGQRLTWRIAVRDESTPFLAASPTIVEGEGFDAASNGPYDIRFTTLPDAWGEAVFVISATDRGGAILPSTTTRSATVTVEAVNDTPFFAPGGDVVVTTTPTEGGGGSAVPLHHTQAWGSGITPGAPDEAISQSVLFILTPVDAGGSPLVNATEDPALLASPVELLPNGTVVVRAVAGAEAILHYEVTLTDTGSPPRSFTSPELLTVVLQSSPGLASLFLTKPPAVVERMEDAGPVSIPGFGELVDRGGGGMSVRAEVSRGAGGLVFASGPRAVLGGGSGGSITLEFEAAPNSFGSAEVTFTASSGNGILESNATTLIRVTPVNDPPSFYIPETSKVLHFLKDDSTDTIPRWAPLEGITAGPNEDGGLSSSPAQQVTFSAEVISAGGVSPPRAANGGLYNTFGVSKFGELLLGLPLRENGGRDAAGVAPPYSVGLRVGVTDSEGLAGADSAVVRIVILEEKKVMRTAVPLPASLQQAAGVAMLEAYNAKHPVGSGGVSAPFSAIPADVSDAEMRDLEAYAVAHTPALLDAVVKGFRGNLTQALGVEEGGIAVSQVGLSLGGPAATAMLEWTLSTPGAADAFVAGQKDGLLDAIYANTTYIEPPTTSVPDGQPLPAEGGGGGGGGLSPPTLAFIIGGAVLLVAVAAAGIYCWRSVGGGGAPEGGKQEQFDGSAASASDIEVEIEGERA